jgi:hypothetical protein
MKYLIPVALLLALPGCESRFPESQDSARGALSQNVASEEIASGKAPSYLDEPLRAMVDQRGLYRLVRSDGQIDDPTTSTGKAVLKPVIELVKPTERIPIIKGAQMYLQYRFWYLPDRPAWIDLRRVLKHPEMKLPDGRVATGSDYTLKQRVSVNQAIGYTGYGLDQDYELVEGDWVFEIWYQDKKMIEQTFTTYWPDEEEIAALKPVLDLGNKVLTKIGKPNHANPKLNWPRVIVGEKETSESPALTEMKKTIENPMSQEPPQ